MAFGQDFLKGFFNTDGLRDYRHASKTFRTNGYGLSPKPKFLYHVSFQLNQAIPKLNEIIPLDDQKAYSLLVKSVEMPSYDTNVTELNQYNRKRYAQTKIQYNPINITFHDDTDDLIRNLWYNYYTYYYKDPSQPYDNLSVSDGTLGKNSTGVQGNTYNARDIYDQTRQGNDWGFIGESYTDGVGFINDGGKPPFFRDIRITGLSQHKTSTYVLINPIITAFRGDTYDYSQGNGTMSNTMTIKYETVKYYQGAIGNGKPDTNVFGFADPAHYDQLKSPLTIGTTATVLGQGGLLDTGIGIVSDLENRNVIGAIQKAGAAYKTFRNVNFKEVARDEAIQEAKKVVSQSQNVKPMVNSVNGMFFPTPPRK